MSSRTRSDLKLAVGDQEHLIDVQLIDSPRVDHPQDAPSPYS